MTPETAADRHREATRQAILNASLTQLRQRPAEPFSHEAVAIGANVSARTVYRYFPTRNDLTAALWAKLRDETGTRWPQAEEEIVPQLRRTFRQFEEVAELTRAAIAAAATTDYPVHGSAEGRAAFRKSLSVPISSLSAAEGKRLVAACVAIYSAPFWQMLRDRGQLSAADAEEAAATAMQAIISAARLKAAAPTRQRRK
ncbi:MAG: TetR family transcriptional regulator [Devosia sp.]